MVTAPLPARVPVGAPPPLPGKLYISNSVVVTIFTACVVGASEGVVGTIAVLAGDVCTGGWLVAKVVLSHTANRHQTQNKCLLTECSADTEKTDSKQATTDVTCFKKKK